MARGKRPNTPGSAAPRKGGLKRPARRARPQRSEAEIAELAAENKVKADAAFDIIASGVREINDDTSLRAFLDGIRGKNAGYSFSNQMLIRYGYPESVAVGVPNHWRKLGRYVKEEEKLKPLYLLRPGTGFYKEDDDDPDKKVFIPTSYIPMKVYDLSQTDGDDLPEGFLDDQLAPIVGDSQDAKTLGLRSARWAEKMGLTVKPGDGVSDNKTIQYPADLDLNERAVHVTRQVVRHALKDMYKFGKMEAEEQNLAVEVATYTLASGYGLDVPASNLKNVKFVAKDPKKLEDTLGVAQNAVRNFINSAAAASK
jgi:hypothetical protein